MSRHIAFEEMLCAAAGGCNSDNTINYVILSTVCNIPIIFKKVT